MKHLITEIKKIHKIAIPIVFMQIFFVLMEITDCVMASWIDEKSFAALSIGNGFTIIILVSMFGVASAIAPVVSHCCGQGRPESAGSAFQHMLILIGILSLFVIIMLAMSFHFLNWFGIEREIAQLSSEYLHARLYGILPIAVFVVVQHFFEGIGKTISIMVIAGVGFLINIPLNFCFINGWLGLPALGVAGIGYATSLVELLLSVIAILSLCQEKYKQYCVLKFKNKPKLKECMVLLRLGFPIGITLAAETGLWSLETFLLAKISIADISAHQIAVNINSLIFMIPLGISAGMYSRIGFVVGKISPKYRIKRIAWIGIMTTGIFMIISGICVSFGRESLVRLYTTSDDTSAIILKLLVYLTLFFFIDGLQVTLKGILQGFKDTTVPMTILLFSNWAIGFCLGYYLAIILEYGVYGFWIGNGVGIFIAIIFLSIRYNKLLNRYEKMLLTT